MGNLWGKTYHTLVIDDMVKMHRCPICDEQYDKNSNRAKVHKHPEPQSGKFRDVWLRSKLPYEIWVNMTKEGYLWDMLTASRRWNVNELLMTLNNLL